MIQNKNSFEWSCRFKHEDLQISKNNLIRTIDSTRQSVCCLSIYEMDDKEPTIHNWIFKIVKFSIGIGLGICTSKEAIDNRFKINNWRQAGHGHQCFSSDGYAVSSSDWLINFQRQSVEYRPGDTLFFQYEPAKGKLSVRKEQQSFSLVIDKFKGKKYRICAYLLSAGDQVILNFC